MPEAPPRATPESIGFTCACCGQRHDGLPDLVFRAPTRWNPARAAQDPDSNRLDEDCCIVGGKEYFIRGVLTVPIQGTDESFGWGVWISQSEASFRAYVESFESTPERPTFGRLANRLPTYPDTLDLEVRAHRQTDGQRPWVEILACDHPLYRDWRHGITQARAIELAQLALHPGPR